MGDNEIIRSSLDKILMYYGAIPPKGRGNWTCLSSRHKNPRDNLSVKGDICSCHCGIKGDSFTVIGEIEGLNYKDKEQFLLIVKKAFEILNMPVEYKESNRHEQYERKKPTKYDGNTINELTQIISEVSKKAKTMNYIYFKTRGIINPYLFKKYKLIVGNPKRIFPSKLLPNLTNIWAYEFIIPIMKDNKVVNCVLRRNDSKSLTNNKTLNLKGLPVELFNGDYLKKPNLKYIFICEGVFDALTFENFGHKALSINSVVMINKLFDMVYKNLKHLNKTWFFIALDNDQAGRKAAHELRDKFRTVGIISFILKIKDYKDINEYYCNNQKSFLESIDKVIPI